MGAAIGIKGDYLDRASALSESGVDMIVLDVAHGHSDSVMAALKRVKKELPELSSRQAMSLLPKGRTTSYLPERIVSRSASVREWPVPQEGSQELECHS